MRGATSFLAVSIIALSLAGCADQMSSEVDDRAVLAHPEFGMNYANFSAKAELQGETAGAYGDNQTATKLFERSFAERPSLLNEFNLAAEYARTGRPLEAIALYSRVADSGSREEATSESPVRVNGAETRFVLADEAAQRLIELRSTSVSGRHDAPAMTANQAASSDAAKQPG